MGTYPLASASAKSVQPWNDVAEAISDPSCVWFMLSSIASWVPGVSYHHETKKRLVSKPFLGCSSLCGGRQP